MLVVCCPWVSCAAVQLEVLLCVLSVGINGSTTGRGAQKSLCVRDTQIFQMMLKLRGSTTKTYHYATEPNCCVCVCVCVCDAKSH